MPTPRLRLVKALPPVILRRPRDGKQKPNRRPASTEPAFASLADVGGWDGLSEMLFGDHRLAEPKRNGNVVELKIPGRRSTHSEILEVMQSDIRRGRSR